MDKKVVWDIKNFIQLERIGCGRFSNVFRVQEIKKTGKEYSAKIFRDLIPEKSKEFINLVRQISITLKNPHPAIHKYYGISPYDFNHENRPVIFSEYMVRGSLSNIIDYESEHVIVNGWDDTKKLINTYGIASAMKHLHSKNILHRDLKPENIFEDTNYYPKVSDFDFTIFNTEKNVYFQSLGTPLFMAPEVISGIEKASFPSDVFSYAVTIYLIWNGNSYYKDKSTFQIIESTMNGIRPEIKETVPEVIKELIEDCWSQDPKDRPTFEQIVNRLKTNPPLNRLINPYEYNVYNDYILYVESQEQRQGHEEEEEEIKRDEDILIFRKCSYHSEGQPIILNTKIIDIKKFVKKKLIGSGFSGDVYKIKSIDTGESFAAKIMKDEITNQRLDSVTLDHLREVKILSQISHPSIVKFYGYSGSDFNDLCHPVIVTEYLRNKSLENIIEIERNGFNITFWNDTLKFICIYGIASSMAYLHSQNIIHRDLKPSNVLMDDFLLPKLADFGFSKEIIQSNNNNKLSDLKGTFAFIAPEILIKKDYSKAGDVYAFAMLLYEMITKIYPFSDKENTQITYAVVMKHERPKLQKEIPQHYKELIIECWNQDPIKRPTFEKILYKLENDKRFHEKVNKSVFENYKKYINEEQIESKPISGAFDKHPLKNVYTTFNENKSILLLEGFLDIDMFDQQSEIYEDDSSTFCDIVDKLSGQMCSAEISKFDVENISKAEISELSNEIEILSKLNHPTIHRFIEYSLVNFEHHPRPVIVREHASHKTLFDVIKNQRKGVINSNWNDTQKLIVVFGIASGMSYLHSHDILHKELNCKNILLDENLNPKISEFGLKPKNEKIIHAHSSNENSEFLYYVAPEILMSNEFTKSSDVYSFAFIVYEITSNKKPFDDQKAQKNKNLRPSLESVPSIYREMISSCWAQNPLERPTFDSIVDDLKSSKFFSWEIIDETKYLNYIENMNERKHEESNDSKQSKVMIPKQQEENEYADNFWI